MKNLGQEGLTISVSQEGIEQRQAPKPILKRREVESIEPKLIETGGPVVELKESLGQGVENADRLIGLAQRGYSAIAQYQQDSLSEVVQSFYDTTANATKAISSDLAKQSDQMFAELEAELANIIPGF